MDYFQGVVAEFLRADRACFINSEFFISIDPSKGEYQKDKHWFVDVLAIHLTQQRAYLCEVTYARKPVALINRLGLWKVNWATIRQALQRDAGIPLDWPVYPWIFVPAEFQPEIRPTLERLFPGEYRLSKLEDTVPWKYPNWNRIDNDFEPGTQAS